MIGQMVYLYVERFKTGKMCTGFVAMAIYMLSGPGQGGGCKGCTEAADEVKRIMVRVRCEPRLESRQGSFIVANDVNSALSDAVKSANELGQVYNGEESGDFTAEGVAVKNRARSKVHSLDDMIICGPNQSKGSCANR